MNFFGIITMSVIMLYISSYIKLILKYNKKVMEIKETPKVKRIDKFEIKDPEVKKFEKKLVHLKSFNESFFYNNAISLKIEKTSFLSKIYPGLYDIKNNIIHLTNNFEFPHELNHMSSTFYDGENYYSGFSQKGVGDGLNEGYTELLSERYFNKKDSYPVETKIMSNLEKIIGRDKMEYFYYTADLYNLIKELEQYDSKENIRNFINCVDILSNLIDNYFGCRMYNFILKKCMKKINLYLLKWYSLKQKRLMESNKITNKECYNNIYRYSKRLINFKNMEDIKYKVLNKKIIEKKVKEYL